MRKFAYDYPHPAVTTDIVIFSIRPLGGVDEPALHVLLIKRGEEPFKGKWALPGGFLKVEYTSGQTKSVDHSLVDCAKRELLEETGLNIDDRIYDDIYLEQVGAYGDIGRDPRQRVVTVAYFALIPWDNSELTASGDAAHAEWVPYHKIRNLAFDHRVIVNDAKKRLEEKVQSRSLDDFLIALKLLPSEFTFSEAQAVREAITGQPEDKRNFRKMLQEKVWMLDKRKNEKKQKEHMVFEEIGLPEKSQGRHRRATLLRKLDEKPKR